ncbi:MAG: 1-acyl-sn-glycerol-3-phosphate acyltransferase [Anaerolineales bacterium]
MTSPIENLTQINLDDLVNAFGIQNHRTLTCITRFIFLGAARKFAKQMIDFDSMAGTRGLAEAARLMERLYVRDVRVFGAERLPDSAFLALSNHPGMTDTLALFSALNRNDLKIIALNRPFLLSLPNISKQLFYVTDNPADRVALVRHVSAHLRNGRSILTFPAGHNEPDPDVYDGAVDSLESWTDSVGVFIRLAPQTPILPIVVRSVVWKRLAQSPIIRIKRTRDERELLVVALQLLAMVMLNIKPVTVTVQIGKPITSKDLGTTETQVIHQAVLTGMKQLIENQPEGEGISALNE